MQFTTLLAQAAGGGFAGLGTTPIMFAAIIGIFYFMVIRPQQKRMKEHQSLVANIKRGDEVVITGGIHGTIYEVKDTFLLIEIAKNTVIKTEKNSVQSVKASGSSTPATT